MIKFFNNIRKKLAEQNKVAPYLRYAIGEIVLVVIGILIALAINNWNSNNNEITKYKKQLLKVVENIKSDSIQLNQLKHYRLDLIDLTSQMMKEIIDRNIVDQDTFLTGFMRLTGERKFVPDMDYGLGNEFEDYHSRHIHDLLDEYLKLSEKVKFREQRHNDFSENMEMELWKNGFFRTIGPKMTKDNQNSRFAQNFNKLDMEKIGIYDNEPLYALCLRAEYGFSLLLLEYDELLAKGEVLSNAIKDFLKVN